MPVYRYQPSAFSGIAEKHGPCKEAIHESACCLQIEGEFPEILPIKESLIKYVFEPNAKQVSRC